MSCQIHLGTRKGLFTLMRQPAGWEVTRVDFLSHPVSMLLDDPRDKTLYVALNLGHFGTKLHRSADRGATWEECGLPAYPEGAVIGGMPGPAGESEPKPASLKEIWALEAGGADQPGVIWAGTIPGGLFQSKDRGMTWELVRGLWDHPNRMKWFGGGKDEPGIHSICVNPRDSRRVMVGISCGSALLTEDGGTTWEVRGQGLRADYMPPEMAYDTTSQDVHRLVACAADPEQLWIQHHNGIFHSTNGGREWTELKDVKPAVFGFAAAVHPKDPQTAWFVPGIKDEQRIPVDGQFCVTRTRDGGATFEQLRNGLPQKHCYDLVYRHCLDVDSTGDMLVMGSTTGNVWVSENGGDSWQIVSQHLPPVYCTRFAA